MKLGALEYVLKPFRIIEIINLIDQALEARAFLGPRCEATPGLDMPSSDAIIGQSPAMLEVYKSIGRVASNSVNVLIRGESGTGKDLVARAIHHYGPRADGPFQVIDCVSIPESLLESELFGYEKGAFTGAVGRHAGKVESARGGTVFLDEIGDMPLSIQAKILRLIQEKRFQRLGGNESIGADVRIVAATNRNLEQALAEKQFREDLYYRLKVVSIWVPPLRERLDDIELLTDFFLRRHAREMAVVNSGLCEDAWAVLHDYHWPGNVRELSNILQKALIFSQGRRISAHAIKQAIRGRDGIVAEVVPTDMAALWIRGCLEARQGEGLYQRLMERFSRMVVGEALDMTGGNRTHAARMLGISRQALLAKIARYRDEE